MKPTATSQYRTRMQRVLDHIEANPDGDLDLATLAGLAAFSRHHFHRQFSGLFGVSVHRYVQMVRLKRAAWRLAYRPRESVLTIALDSGYEGPEAFSRAFRKHTGMSLVQYVKRLRINLACQILMSDEQAPITDICFEVGFNNLSNFNRQFRAEKGMTPSRFRLLRMDNSTAAQAA